MTIHGEYWLPSNPVESWAALASPEILKRCLEGCVLLEPISAREYALKFVPNNGPLDGEFEARARLGNISPQSTAVLAGEVDGRGVGSLGWRMELMLEPDSGGSMLKYSFAVDSNGGNHATDRTPIEKFVREIADRFLAALSHEVSSTGDRLHVVQAHPAVRSEGGVVAELARRMPSKRSRTMQWIWLAVFILIALRLLSYFES